MRRLWQAWRFFRPDLPAIAGVVCLLLLGIWANLLKPWPIAVLVDSALGGKPVPGPLRALADGLGPSGLLAMLAGAVLALHGGQALLSTTQNYLSIGIGLRGLRRVREEVFERLLRLSLKFHSGSQSGDTIYRATWDTYAFQTLFQQGLITFLTATLTLAFMVVVMARLNGRLTLAALAAAPLLFVTIKLFGRAMRERGILAQSADSRVATLVQQCVALLPLTQSLAREDEESAKFRAEAGQAQNHRLSQHAAELVYWLAVSLVFAAGTGTIVWLGGAEVARGRLTVGELLIFLAYLTQLYEPLNQLSHVGSTIATATAGASRVFALLETPDEVAESPDAAEVTLQHAPQSRPLSPPSQGATPQPRPASPSLELTPTLTFDRVSFAYRDGAPVLDAIHMTIPAGQNVALVGASGAGKSTLLHLVPRFADPTSGRLLLDGHDIRELRLAPWRRQVGFAMQEALLISGTVAENIGCGRPGATREAIINAARAAQAHEFISRLGDGYDTPVGEGAARLSAGERQRINLARVLLKAAPILLLDEPTSALDPETEAAVLKELRALFKTRTVLFATHRLETILGMDRVLVLDRGRLVEDGSPAELLAQPSSFLARNLAPRP